jgi:hypothetical protein
MSQNGSVCERDGVKIWENKLSVYEKMSVYAHVHSIMQKFPIQVPNDDDLVQDRGAQISYSLVGHHAPKDLKKDFDPTGALRNAVLRVIPFEFSGMTVKVGGTTCLDYIRDNATKAHNLIELLGEQLRGAVYVGDQLYDGGNDSDVKNIEGLTTIEVAGPTETLSVIKDFLLD